MTPLGLCFRRIHFEIARRTKSRLLVRLFAYAVILSLLGYAVLEWYAIRSSGL